ncbi:MAG: hypothetical protein HONDAALG_04549 [Gammaproteobacteria bacterium]|nr:hypothetical protein [Gammaproteobacteria bacterium]
MEKRRADWGASDRQAIQEQLSRILASPQFALSDRRQRFLRYLLEETLAGHGPQLKGYTVGLEVFGKPPSFDPNIDPAVRIEAGRLRDKLREFYEDAGRDDPIHIALPKGTYALEVHVRGQQSMTRTARPANLTRINGERFETGAQDAAPASAHRIEVPSLAVLPFVNMSSEPDQEYFADGLTDNLITDLSKVSGLFVISRHTSFAYKATLKPLAEIARAVGVRYLVDGSVRRSREHIRVSANLVDPSSDRCLWADRYDRDASDVFRVQDEISRNIIEALKVRLTPLESERLGYEGTGSDVAHDAVLRGLEHFWKYTSASCAEAQRHFQRAVEYDPHYAAAHAWLARTYLFQYSMNWSAEPETALATGLGHAWRAVSLDDLLPFAHAILGWALLWSGEPKGAQAAGHRACALDPNNADAHLFLSMTLSVTDRAEDGLRCIEKGLRLNPHPSSFYFYALGLCHQMLGQYDKAIAAMERGIEINPRFMPNQASLPVLYEMTGRHDLACALVERAKAAIAGWSSSLLLRYRPEFYHRFLIARQSIGMELNAQERGLLEAYSSQAPLP